MSGLADMITGRGRKDAKKAAAEAARSRRADIASQEAILARQRIAAEDQEETEGRTRAATMRSLRARQRARGSFAYAGLQDKKTTFGA